MTLMEQELLNDYEELVAVQEEIEAYFAETYGAPLTEEYLEEAKYMKVKGGEIVDTGAMTQARGMAKDKGSAYGQMAKGFTKRVDNVAAGIRGGKSYTGAQKAHSAYDAHVGKRKAAKDAAYQGAIQDRSGQGWAGRTFGGLADKIRGGIASLKAGKAWDNAGGQVTNKERAKSLGKRVRENDRALARDVRRANVELRSDTTSVDPTSKKGTRGAGAIGGKATITTVGSKAMDAARSGHNRLGLR